AYGIFDRLRERRLAGPIGPTCIVRVPSEDPVRLRLELENVLPGEALEVRETELGDRQTHIETLAITFSQNPMSASRSLTFAAPASSSTTARAFNFGRFSFVSTTTLPRLRFSTLTAATSSPPTCAARFVTCSSVADSGGEIHTIAPVRSSGHGTV